MQARLRTRELRAVGCLLLLSKTRQPSLILHPVILQATTCLLHHVRLVSSYEKAQGNAPASSLRNCHSFPPPPQALWRKNPQDEIDFLAAARGPDIVAIEQDKSASFILDTASPTPRSSRLHRPLKSLASLAPHPEAEAAAKIFSIGKSESRFCRRRFCCCCRFLYYKAAPACRV
jgi:hypothetical protein